LKLIRPDRPYKPLHIFVLDPLEYTAMGLAVMKKMGGEKAWERARAARFAHPDPQKTACVHAGAIIYTAFFPERTHKEHRPPEAWMREVGITEASLAEARKLLELDQPNYSAKMDVRRAVNDAMDAAYGDKE
jgi:hypothetical protein